MEVRIKEIMAAVFSADASEITENITQENLENWDSLRHVNLVAALEEEFEIEFSFEEIGEIVSFEKIISVMKDKTNSMD